MPNADSPAPLLELPALADEGSDPATATAALDAALPDDAPADVPPDTPPSDAPPPKRGPGRPAAPIWSDRKIARASRAELRARVRDLQERAAAAPSRGPDVTPTTGGVSDPPPPPLTPADLVAPLALTWPTLAQLAAAGYGDHWTLTDAEAVTLATAWAPIALRYAGAAGDAMPWAVALLTTAHVLAPKYRQHVEAARGNAVPASELPPPMRGPDA